MQFEFVKFLKFNFQQVKSFWLKTEIRNEMDVYETILEMNLRH